MVPHSTDSQIDPHTPLELIPIPPQPQSTTNPFCLIDCWLPSCHAEEGSCLRLSKTEEVRLRDGEKPSPVTLSEPLNPAIAESLPLEFPCMRGNIRPLPVKVCVYVCDRSSGTAQVGCDNQEPKYDCSLV